MHCSFSTNSVPFQLQEDSIYESILYFWLKKLKKIFRQPWTRYFWTFLPFCTISLYQQGYETKLLSPEIEYRSFLTNCRSKSILAKLCLVADPQIIQNDSGKQCFKCKHNIKPLGKVIFFFPKCIISVYQKKALTKLGK